MSYRPGANKQNCAQIPLLAAGNFIKQYIRDNDESIKEPSRNAIANQTHAKPGVDAKHQCAYTPDCISDDTHSLSAENIGQHAAHQSYHGEGSEKQAS